MNKKQS